MKDIQVLAPAGSYESLTAAIKSGADCVYFGITQLNMRARSSANFTLEDLKKIAEICHKEDVRGYLTMNTLLYDHDVILMKKIIDTAKESGVDAIIAADVAAIEYAKSVGLEVHISTQLSISNIEGVRFWSKYADVIVLAREVDLKMMKRICEQIKEDKILGPSGKLVKIEVFAHGALCIAVSGRCGMSLFNKNSSANRGACKQECRQSYIVKDKERGIEMEIDNDLVMSPKDICTIDFLDELIATGVSVLKLEGRGRSPDYVDTVVRSYCEARDSVIDGTFDNLKVTAWRAKMMNVYNRGFSTGYYLGKNLEQTKTSGSAAKEEKTYVGIIEHYYPKVGVAEVTLQASELNTGDSFVITGESTGVVRGVIDSMRSEDEKVIEKGERQTLVTISISDPVRKNDKLYKVKKRDV